MLPLLDILVIGLTGILLIAHTEPVRNNRAVFYDNTRKDHADHAHQFDENVQTRACCILERVANGIADNGCFVGR